MVIERVQILERVVQSARYVLNQMGAEMTLTEDRTERDANGRITGYLEFVVEFPQLTTREDTHSHPNPRGEGTATYFTLTTFSGRTCRGVDIWPGYYGDWDPGSTSLYVP